MKIISPKLHATLDYLTVVFLFVAPSVFPISEIAGYVCYLLAIVHLLLTITTDFSGGVIRIIPYRVHGLVEFFVAWLLGISAFAYFRSNETDKLFFAVLGIVIMIVFLLTDFKRSKLR